MDTPAAELPASAHWRTLLYSKQDSSFPVKTVELIMVFVRASGRAVAVPIETRIFYKTYLNAQLAHVTNQLLDVLDLFVAARLHRCDTKQINMYDAHANPTISGNCAPCCARFGHEGDTAQSQRHASHVLLPCQQQSSNLQMRRRESVTQCL